MPFARSKGYAVVRGRVMPSVRRLACVIQFMGRVPRRDVIGARLRVGDTVRVVGVPDLTRMSPACLAKSLPVFRHLVGKYKRVAEFDEQGMAWISFRIRKGLHAGLHSVGIEPWLLRKRRARGEEAPPSSAA